MPCMLLVNMLHITECNIKQQCYEIQHVYLSLYITGDMVTNLMKNEKSLHNERNVNTVCRIKKDAAIYSDLQRSLIQCRG